MRIDLSPNYFKLEANRATLQEWSCETGGALTDRFVPFDWQDPFLIDARLAIRSG
ncbi:MAG: hypothetical protein P0Y59_04570 [Candidatus Sphingomonas phytovorans]|nr:hypothetical protein [Sphingomonas sp.]WEK00975.1 MAG: hypothetical protein P0Y59_04570 [Sphingomonas sp.]